jgi:membrane-bound ClpP family serine protease
MSVTLIIILILLGIFLFLIEFLLVPGITVAGIGGAILMIGGVILGYHYHGPTVGNIILLGTVVFSILTLLFVLKSRTWKKVMLDSKIESRVNQLDRGDIKVKVGDIGVTITRLNPMGKVLIGGEYYEAQSLNKLIDEKTPIEVIKVSENKIIVKSQN